MKDHKPFFWLHIKKSAGSTTRQLLEPHYTTLENVKKPKIFIQAQKNEYNDILNNHKIPLGEYQFRRGLFAKKFLYPDEWDNTFSFAFSREPVDRCVSMFFYLFWKRTDRNFIKRLAEVLKQSGKHKKVLWNTSYAFDLFLDLIQQAQVSDSIYRPVKLHFTTHVNPMWNDITDEDNNIILTKLFRMENLTESINQVFEECGIDKKIPQKSTSYNVNKKRRPYEPSKEQLKVIQQIYKNDFEIYESLK